MSDETNDTNVDELYDRIMGGGDSDGPSGVNETPAPAVAAPTPQEVAEFEFVHNGKPIKSNRENVLKWAQQGYDYSQKMAEFNRRLNETNQKYSQAEQLSKTYGPVDEWVKANPGKWDALQAAIQQNENSGANPELLQKLKVLEERLSKTDSFIETLQEKEQRQVMEKEDADLDNEIKSIRDKYADLDWNSQNEKGHSVLEYRVLEHATKIGTNSFRAAFNDLLHDDLVKQAESRGRESLTKERTVKASNGVLGTTQAPTKGLTRPTNLKSKSYDDLMREGLEELGITP